MKIIQLIIVLSTLCLNLNGQEITVFVSPVGNDKYEGTIDKPVATIEKAQHLVRKIKRQHQQNDTITIFLREGTYRLRQGIVFYPIDGGYERWPIIYRSYNGEEVTISGAIPIENHKPLSRSHYLYEKDNAIGKKIIEINLLEAGLSELDILRFSRIGRNVTRKSNIFRELYLNGKSMPLSRWPNKGFSKFIDVITDTSSIRETIGIIYKDPQISSWENSTNILLHGYWKFLWDDAYEYVSEIDTANKIMWLNPPYNNFKFEKNRPFAAYNVITEIDKPGEWAYDYEKGKIYFYPPNNLSDSTLEFSICEDPLFSLHNTQWITFKDIHFEMSAYEGLRIANCNNISINNCKINGCASEGIKMYGGKNNTISSCEIYDIGRGAMYVSGGNRETLEKSGFLIDNCYIHHLSRIDRTYTPGVWVEGVGTTITHCEFHDIPSSAMNINGNNHIIEYNEMYHVVTESDDQGAIDMYGNPTYRGNIFRYNYIHDIGPYGKDEVNAFCGRAGIRLDDAISGNSIYANIFKNCSLGNMGAVQIHGGKENMIQNNLFYKCSLGLSFNTWSYNYWIKFTKKRFNIFERNRELYLAHYPQLCNLNGNLNKNTIIRNIFLQCGRTTRHRPEVVIFKDNIETNENKGLINLEKDEYSFKNISVLLKKNKLKPIPFAKIGLRAK